MKSIPIILKGVCIFSLLLLFNYVAFAQQNLDSLLKVRQAEQAKRLIIEDSLLAIERYERINDLLQSPIDSIKKLTLTNLKIETLPDISVFSKAIFIDFRNNQIEKVQTKNWPDSDSLEKIILSNNQIKKVRFKKSASVTTLDLSENELKRIPYSVRKLKNLKFLDVSKNHIKRIPCFLKKMDSLQELTINYNQLKKLSKRDIKKFKNLKSIHMGANGLTHIPQNINELSEIETLNFGINSISTLPATFSELISLEHLIFYRNQFEEMPEEIWALKKLKQIDFYHNQIKKIPDAIGSLDSLLQIFLAYNKIEEIPDTIFKLKKLKALYIHHNKIVMVPKEITQLNNLTYLDLGYNRIFEIPDLSALKNLMEIDLQENTLSEFPYELTEIESLRKIYLMGNPFVMTKEERKEMEELSQELEGMGISLFF